MGTTGPWCWWGWLETPPEECGEIQGSLPLAKHLLVMEDLVSFGAGGPQIWQKGGERLGLEWGRAWPPLPASPSLQGSPRAQCLNVRVEEQ